MNRKASAFWELWSRNWVGPADFTCMSKVHNTKAVNRLLSSHVFHSNANIEKLSNAINHIHVYICVHDLTFESFECNENTPNKPHGQWKGPFPVALSSRKLLFRNVFYEVCLSPLWTAE